MEKNDCGDHGDEEWYENDEDMVEWPWEPTNVRDGESERLLPSWRTMEVGHFKSGLVAEFVVVEI